ncbi:MAG: glycosyltransferase family 4 protein [Verrucomicrobia bacterium]|nr:glycosyltransferase family 4 protein [Verrucomicrobiota bacterium]
MSLLIAFLALISGLATWLGVKRLRVLALQRNLVDKPNERSSHTVPVPRVGGIPIFGISWLAMCFIISLGYLGIGPTPGPGWLGFLAGAFLVGCISLLEDVRELPRLVRFGVHALAGILVLIPAIQGTSIELPVVGSVLPSLLVWILCLIWIVGLTNAYNFMDGIDGIAGTQGLIAGIGWFFTGIGTGFVPITAAGAIIAATCAAFLLHNWAPAKIFMGDVGSTFLGFTFACLPFLAIYSTPVDPSQAPFILIAFFLVWPFVVDASFTFMRRARNRENVFQAHRSHLYQRLAANYEGNRTANHRATSGLYGFLAFCGLVASHFYFHNPNLSPWLGLLAVGILFAALFVHTSKVERKA